MTTADAAPLDAFFWEPQPEAQKLVDRLVNRFLGACPLAADLAERMKTETGTRFFDWIDHLVVPEESGLREELLRVGFTERVSDTRRPHFRHEGAIFPEILFGEGPGQHCAIKVESVHDYLAANLTEISVLVEGDPGARLRTACVITQGGAALHVVERHGYRGYSIPSVDPAVHARAMEHYKALRERPRDFDDDHEGFAATAAMVQKIIDDLDVDYACDLFFAAERDYWMSRNNAGRVQKERQDRLGLGWANHDHHTYRSSRHCFKDLIALFEQLGFRCRERFYAGEQAGWGAQVLEQPVTGITIFADVDMSAEELKGDFAHEGFPREATKLGTVGLWCALHGESALKAGMHHLEAQFDWHGLKAQLESEANIKTMDPFTTFPYLRQAFTEGERWTVDPARVDRVLARGFINEQQAAEFKAHGAIGSHLENLERNDGFKGFNQEGVSDIIQRTDPRRLAGVADD